jgi:hypothetical protein
MYTLKTKAFHKKIKRHTEIAMILFISIAISSISGYLGIVNGINLLKYIAVSAQFFALIQSILIIIRFRKNIKWEIATPLITILAIYPLFRIFLSVFANFSFKVFTDGFFSFGGYYELLIIGLALAVTTKRFDSYSLLYKYSYIAIPIGLVLTAYSLKSELEMSIRLAHLSIINCLIPLSLLAFYPSRKKTLFIGYISIVAILFISAKIWSRSYTMVGFYLLISAFIVILKSGNKRIGISIIFFGLLFYFLGLFSFFNESSLIRDESISDKYQFNSLFVSLNNFKNDGDIVKLFFWEGNSRAGILVDAFGKFHFADWIFGVGILGTYSSFVERSTIEMGWAQDAFRWGLVYVIITIFFFILGSIKLKEYNFYRKNQIFKILSVIIIVKLLDGFIYGVPETSVYNLIVFWAVMQQGIRKDIFIRKRIEFKKMPTYDRLNEDNNKTGVLFNKKN